MDCKKLMNIVNGPGESGMHPIRIHPTRFGPCLANRDTDKSPSAIVAVGFMA